MGTLPATYLQRNKIKWESEASRTVVVNGYVCEQRRRSLCSKINIVINNNTLQQQMSSLFFCTAFYPIIYFPLDHITRSHFARNNSHTHTESKIHFDLHNYPKSAPDCLAVCAFLFSLISN